MPNNDMVNRVNFATYPQDYFTGAQARVYFGSIWVDDVATIQWTTAQSKAPLYGYNDHQFRAVARGQFIVNGSFTIAFKETGYLPAVMRLLKNDQEGINKILRDKDPAAMDTLLNYIGKGYTPEEALDIAAQQKQSKQFGFKETQDFEDIAEVMEDAIWGKESSTAAIGRRLQRSDELDYKKYTKDVIGSLENDIDLEGFDILVTFGDYRSATDEPEHTMVSVNDVHITGESMVITPAGEPVGVQYTFFARGLNEKVSSIWPKIDKEEAELWPETGLTNATPEEKLASAINETAAKKEKRNTIFEDIQEIMNIMEGIDGTIPAGG